MTFDPQPVLKDDLVELRPLRADDYDELYAVAADPLIWEQHPDKSRYRKEGFRLFFDQALASGGALVVVDAATQSVIGSTRFHGYDADRSEVEIGWTFLARSHWGGTYNGRMKHLLLEHAFRSVDSVIFRVGVLNMRSQRAVEKLGGVRAGTRPDARGVDSYVYRLTASQYVRIRREELTAEPARALIGALNAELSGVYPEAGATHFSLDPDEVASGRGAFLVAYRDGAPVGCGAVRLIDAATAEIKRMYVTPTWRGAGVGRRLLAALESEAGRLGAGRVVLETGVRQAAALALYTRNGFERIPLYGEYCLSPETSICLGKPLVESGG